MKIDKITWKHRYTGDMTAFRARSQLMESWTNSARDVRDLFEEVIHIGAVEIPGGFFAHVHPWWDPITNTMTIFWWTTDSVGCIKKLLEGATPENIQYSNECGWVQDSLLVESDSPPGTMKEKLLDKLPLFATGVTKIDSDDGHYIKTDLGIEFHCNNGSIAYLTNSDMEYWLWSYMYRKYSRLGMRFGVMDWCEVLPTDISSKYGYNFYHEMSAPNKEPGVSFIDDSNAGCIELNSATVVDFIDQVHNMCPHMKTMRPDYVRWPETPIRIEDRYRDLHGHYWMLYTSWSLTADQWTTMQLSYLNELLNSYNWQNLNKEELLEYAKQQWTIR